MPDNLGALITVVSGIVALFAWALKLLLPYFTKKIDEKDSVIQHLYDSYMNTTDKFTEVMNHKSTEHTESIVKLGSLVDQHIKVSEAQMEILKRVLDKRS